METRLKQLESVIGDEPTGAFFSRDRQHRYLLWRTWAGLDNLLHFVGLNPSVADEKNNDPTIRRCIGFAKREGASGVLVTNLFSYCSTDPKDLKAASNPVRAVNKEWIDAAQALAAKTVACWGVHGTHGNRSLETLGGLGSVFCFGTTRSGEPRHPLYLRGDAKIRLLEREEIKALD